MNPIQDYLNDQGIFLVWGPPSYGPRSKVLTRELGLKAAHFVHLTARRGFWAGPLKYSYQTLKTLWLLFRQRPGLIFVQSPPSFAVLCVYLYCRLSGAKYLVDAHSDALQSWYWLWPEWLSRLWARHAIATIVTNEHFQRMIQDWGGQAFILRDIPTRFDRHNGYPMNGDFNVVVVNTFSNDEPLAEVLAAAARLPQAQFYVTGKKGRAQPGILESAPANVHFTDYLPDESYYGLLNTAQAVMCLTTRNHTMQRGACEALSLGKPIITSDWPLLRQYFQKGTVHVPNTGEGIYRGVQEMMAHYERYRAGIAALQIAQQQEWQTRMQALMTLIQQAVAPPQRVTMRNEI